MHYTWRYSRTAFRYAKNPVFIDMNDSELIQIEKGRTASGFGKLVEKTRFIQRVQVRKDESGYSSGSSRHYDKSELEGVSG